MESKGLKMTTYMFIDGSFLQALIKDTIKTFGLDEDQQFEYERFASMGSRAFYYHSYPEKKPNQTSEEFEEERKIVDATFGRISASQRLHLRTGMSRYQRRLRGREQKGIDILLALDVYRHATRGNIDDAILVTSDIDFLPVLEALLETKVRSTLWYDPRKTNTLLINAADFRNPINQSDIVNYLGEKVSRKFSVGTYGVSPPSSYINRIEFFTSIAKDQWTFTCHIDKKGRLYVGHLNTLPGNFIRSRDYRAMLLWVEKNYNISLEGIEYPDPINLSIPEDDI